MTDAKINYVGPRPGLLDFKAPRTPPWRRLPLGLLLVVVLPTLLAAIYFLLIATPRYVSESHFIVRSGSQNQPSSLGVALQSVGLSASQTDAFAVLEYISSRDGLETLQGRFDLPAIYGPAGADPLSRWPRFWEKSSDEGLYKGFRRFMTVGYNGSTGISVLRVEAFRARDAQALNEALLAGGEALINRLNERAAADAIVEAARTRDEAQARVAAAQLALTAFRNREQYLDPTRAAAESSQLIGGLLASVAQLKAERSQLAAEAPNSPQLPVLNARINAFERQIAEERAKIAGQSDSLAPKVATYEELTMQREFADRELAQATARLASAEQEARRQKLYLERIVNPSLPDSPTQPRRWYAVLTVLMSTLLAYGVGWLLWAGVREHRQP